ncbi:AAA family ATPase [Vagococcus salmoninarum]|uniref:ATPase n=1 Tax=Vagococcus salmoninarum TaxID=2739 RepID=A0A429ZM44_9ENTE|nr:AAA family ATPase [Vagococcus salmoninarum]RST94772.1 ATPase [Vagococcus salmoninarum]
MRYLRSFHFSQEEVKNPNLYPYNSLRQQRGSQIVLDNITLLSGSNGSGKSTLLNVLANKLTLPGAEPPKAFGKVDFFQQYVRETQVTFELDEGDGRDYLLPENSYYIKSEDILYEIKKIQQEAILAEGYLYERKQLGMTKEQLARQRHSYQMQEQLARRQFAQEKYSNGETAMEIYQDYLVADGLYLLDEPEASLSHQNQLKLAELIIENARYLNCQFIIATHSPFLLGTLGGTVYNLDEQLLTPSHWTDLPQIKSYQAFFKAHEAEF